MSRSRTLEQNPRRDLDSDFKQDPRQKLNETSGLLGDDEQTEYDNFLNRNDNRTDELNYPKAKNKDKNEVAPKKSDPFVLIEEVPMDQTSFEYPDELIEGQTPEDQLLEKIDENLLKQRAKIFKKGAKKQKREKKVQEKEQQEQEAKDKIRNMWQDIEDKHGLHRGDLLNLSYFTRKNLLEYLMTQDDAETSFIVMDEFKKKYGADSDQYKKEKKDWEESKKILQTYHLDDNSEPDKIKVKMADIDVSKFIRKYNLGASTEAHRHLLKNFLSDLAKVKSDEYYKQQREEQKNKKRKSQAA